MFDLKMTRRSFLIGSAKIATLAAVAPAIVKAENLMKIQVVKTMEEAEQIIKEGNFTIDGLVPGSSVFAVNELTGEMIVRDTKISGTRASWQIPEASVTTPIRVLVRRPGYKQFILTTGMPMVGCKTKVRASMVQDLIYA